MAMASPLAAGVPNSALCRAAFRAAPPSAAHCHWHHHIQRDRGHCRDLGGLILNTMFGWSWADSIAALVVAALAVREGIEAWRGDVESPFEVLEELHENDQEDREQLVMRG